MNKTRISTKNRNYLNQILALKNTINELKYSIQWFNSRLKQAKESETLENGSFEITELEEKKKKKNRAQGIFRTHQGVQFRKFQKGKRDRKRTELI